MSTDGPLSSAVVLAQCLTMACIYVAFQKAITLSIRPTAPSFLLPFPIARGLVAIHDRLPPWAVQMACVHAAEHVGNFWKPVKPCGFGRNRSGSDYTQR